MKRGWTTIASPVSSSRTMSFARRQLRSTVALMSAERFERYAGALGVEPLDPAFTTEHLSGILRGSRQAVKKVLMDQRLVVGIGNIYANEACWRAGVDPSRAANTLSADETERLHHGIVTVLQDSIAARGTSFRDYRDASGGKGDFARSLAAYGRGGEPCPRCGRALKSAAIGQRATAWCGHCQR